MRILNQLQNVRKPTLTLGAVGFGCAFPLALLWLARAGIARRQGLPGMPQRKEPLREKGLFVRFRKKTGLGRSCDSRSEI